MEELDDFKEEEEVKKIVHTYPLVQESDMSEHMKAETLDIIVTACEKFGTDYYAVAKLIHDTLDKKYGPKWNVVVGETYGIKITHHVHTLMYMFFAGNLGICAWKM